MKGLKRASCLASVDAGNPACQVCSCTYPRVGGIAIEQLQQLLHGVEEQQGL